MKSAGEYSRVNNLVDSLNETWAMYRAMADRVREDGPLYAVRDWVWEGHEEDPKRFEAEHAGLVAVSNVVTGFRDGFVTTVIEGAAYSKKSPLPQPIALLTYTFGKPVHDGVKGVRVSTTKAREATSTGDRVSAIAGVAGSVGSIVLTFFGGAEFAFGKAGAPAMMAVSSGGRNVAAAVAAPSTVSAVAASATTLGAQGFQMAALGDEGGGNGVEPDHETARRMARGERSRATRPPPVLRMTLDAVNRLEGLVTRLGALVRRARRNIPDGTRDGARYAEATTQYEQLLAVQRTLEDLHGRAVRSEALAPALDQLLDSTKFAELCRADSQVRRFAQDIEGLLDQRRALRAARGAE